MKKLLITVALTLALALTFGLAACKDANKQTNSGANGKFDSLNTAQSVYGFSAASAGMLISSASGSASQAPARYMAAPAEVPAGESSQPTQEDNPTSDLDKYMALVESLLSDGGFRIETPQSDRSEYQIKTVVTYRDMQGETHSYVMYYNQIAVPGDDDDDEDENEENYSIEGVMVIDETDYPIRGERETESEKDENESETEFRVTLGENRYMLVEQSEEREKDEIEREYSYSIYENGTRTEKSTFSYENEKDETELKMISSANGVTQTLYFEKETEKGKEVLRLRVGDGTDVKRYIVRVTQGEDGKNSYVYEPVTGSFDD